MEKEGGMSSLLLASAADHVDIVKALLENNGKVDLQDEYGKSSLMFASQHGYINVIGPYE